MPVCPQSIAVFADASSGVDDVVPVPERVHTKSADKIGLDGVSLLLFRLAQLRYLCVAFGYVLIGVRLTLECFAEQPDLVTKPVAFGQNLVYDCHAVYTTTRARSELGLRPRHTLAGGLAQTLAWYRSEGLDRREIDFTAEDAQLRALGA